jgi:hypothetical protein
MMRGTLALSIVATAVGCSAPAYVVVTVDARPAVHDVATLHVSLTNGGQTFADDLTFGGSTFPVTFSIDAPNRSGDLAIAIDALDSSTVLVGHGEIDSTVGAPAATITLDSADFIVNTDYAGDQFLSDDNEAVGFQLAAIADGSWTAVYRDDCPSPCNMYARRFDETGVALDSQVAAGTNGFPLSTVLTDASSTPAVTAGATRTIGVWDSDDETTNTQGISCRWLDPDGTAPTDETLVAIEPDADVVSATALATGNYALTWTATVASSQVIRGLVIEPDCSPIGAPYTVSTVADPAQSAIAANGTNVMFAWLVAGAVHVRLGSSSGGVSGTDTQLLASTASQSIEFVRVAALGTGFAVAVRWADPEGVGPGKIEVYRTSATGTLIGTPTLITDKSASDFASLYAFGLAVRSDGALLVVWHACGASGDGNGCGVFGRVMRPSGVPVGDVFGLATTTIADQTNPSAAALPGAFVAAWSDTSATAPDPSGSAVRARIIYPAYDDASGVLGAACGGTTDASCGAGLLCAAGTDQMPRCYETCTAAGTPCADGGTCSQADASTVVCAY